jgi:hypothetical protein
MKDTGGEKQPLLSPDREIPKDSMSRKKSLIYFIFLAAALAAAFIVYPLKSVIFLQTEFIVYSRIILLSKG